jgi:Ser/Thr protein kinase RdoA (MazF antagonist)
VKELLEDLLGAPIALEDLKYKPGRRRTLRAHGARGTAIVKQYSSGRTNTVALRVASLASGLSEPLVPRVLAIDPDEEHIVVLTDVPGAPLRIAVLERDASECARVGEVLGRWHSFWRGAVPPVLRPHSPARELEILYERASAAEPRIGDRVRTAVERCDLQWSADTVIHRDLYEEQVLLSERVGLIDLDDVAKGPAELDIGNLLGHVDLLGLSHGKDLAKAKSALLDGYRAGGGHLDPTLLESCRRFTLLRLSCIHGDPRLLDLAGDLSSVSADGLIHRMQAHKHQSH